MKIISKLLSIILSILFCLVFFSGCDFLRGNPPKTYEVGSFFSLRDAYELGLVEKSDLEMITTYNRYSGGLSCVNGSGDPIDGEPDRFPVIEQILIIGWAKYLTDNHGYTGATDGISIGEFCGLYQGLAVVRMSDPWLEYSQALWDDCIGGITFHYTDGQELFACIIEEVSLTWTQIASATLAEVTKADANYKAVFSSSTYEVIVDGNKMIQYGTVYNVMEGDERFEYFFTSGAWYKTLRTGGWTPSATMGEWAAFSAAGLAVVRNALLNPQNVQDLGNGKYSYYQNGMGPDPDTFIFTTSGRLVTEIESTVYGGSGIIMYRTSVWTYTYGGQTVTLPTEFIFTTKLAIPENLYITDGTLTWDEVEGAGYYAAFIDKDGIRLLNFLQIDSAELNFNEYAARYNFTSGTYQISIWAEHPTTNTDYRSEQATIEYAYTKP